MPDSRYARLIVFGDSDSDGGAGARGIFELNGHAWPAPPSHAGRFCDGPVWPEILAPRLGLVYAPRDNYAVGGATTGMRNVAKGPEYVNTGMLAQVRDFLATERVFPADALAVLYGGGNNLWLVREQPGDEVVTGGIDDLAKATSQLRAAGAHHFVFVTVARPGLFPIDFKGARSAMDAAAVAWNEALRRWVAELRQSAAGTVALVDLGDLLERAAADPATYGFDNATDACLTDGVLRGDPARFLFWDAYHMTSAFHRGLAAAFQDALE